MSRGSARPAVWCTLRASRLHAGAPPTGRTGTRQQLRGELDPVLPAQRVERLQRLRPEVLGAPGVECDRFVGLDLEPLDHVEDALVRAMGGEERHVPQQQPDHDVLHAALEPIDGRLRCGAAATRSVWPHLSGWEHDQVDLEVSFECCWFAV